MTVVGEEHLHRTVGHGGGEGTLDHAQGFGFRLRDVERIDELGLELPLPNLALHVLFALDRDIVGPVGLADGNGVHRRERRHAQREREDTGDELARRVGRARRHDR